MVLRNLSCCNWQGCNSLYSCRAVKRQKIERDMLEKDKTKQWISALSTKALLRHIKYKKEGFGRINKSVSRSIRQSTYHNWRRLVAVLVVVVAHIRGEWPTA